MSFAGYKENVIQLVQDLDDIQGYCSDLGLDGAAEAAGSMVEHLKADEFNVAVVGEFNRGKSTLINALLEKRVLPDGIRPTTAVVNKVKYGIAPSATVEYKDGRCEQIAVDDLAQYVTKLTPDGEERAKTIKEVTVYYPLNYCKNGVTLIDTPGLNDVEAMTEVTLSVLAEADAAIMVMFGAATFSQTERRFLESHLLSGDIGRVLFVVTGMDMYDEEEQQEILESCRYRIEEYVVKKARDLYGEDSEEYQAQTRKLGQLQVYGVSARNAVRAKERGDDQMLAESNFPAFEEGLERFLTEERGAITLSVPVSRIKATVVELYQALRLRESALQMESEEFNEKYEQATDEMRRVRAERSRELARVTDAANACYAGLGEQLEGYWPAIREAALAAVDAYPISKGDVKTTEGQAAVQEALLEAAKQAMSQAAQEQTEQIQTLINRNLSEEADRVSGFEDELLSSMEYIKELFVPVDSEQKNPNLAATVGEIALNYYTFGIGSVVDGYQKAGWKGALLGGLSGGLGSFAAAYGISVVLSALSISVALPVAVVLAAVAATVGLFTGRTVIDKTLGPDPEKFRDAFKKGLAEQLDEAAASQDISAAVREQVDTMFDALKQKVIDESERVLGDTQSQLDTLKLEVSRRTVMGEAEKQKFQQTIEDLDQITARAVVLEQQLNDVLARGALPEGADAEGAEVAE